MDKEQHHPLQGGSQHSLAAVMGQAVPQARLHEQTKQAVHRSNVHGCAQQAIFLNVHPDCGPTASFADAASQ
jgi:hypothetical protein